MWCEAGLRKVCFQRLDKEIIHPGKANNIGVSFVCHFFTQVPFPEISASVNNEERQHGRKVGVQKKFAKGDPS